MSLTFGLKEILGNFPANGFRYFPRYIHMMDLDHMTITHHQSILGYPQVLIYIFFSYFSYPLFVHNYTSRCCTFFGGNIEVAHNS